MAAPKAYPLKWPPGWPRAEKRTNAQFRTSLNAALKNVQEELRRFGTDTGSPVGNVVISSNVTLGEINPKDAGVAIYFTWDGEQRCIPIDRYTRVEHNLQAIFHVINADRTKLRHGGLVIVRAAFQGLTPLPAPPNWRRILGFAASAAPGQADVKRRYHELAMQHHPDQGGDEQQFLQIKSAFETAQAEIGEGS